MKLLSFQPCSLYQNGGCGRVLRRLYAGKEEDVFSISVNVAHNKVNTGKIKEEQLALFPQQQKWMRWKLRNINGYLQSKLMASLNRQHIRNIVQDYSCDVIHAVNHGAYSASLCTPGLIKGKQLWVSFHDHYSLCSSFSDCEMLWKTAGRRLVISKELGEEYARLFSKKPFEIITDGIKRNEFSVPRNIEGNTITIYFGGLLHYHYLELFKLLAHTLNKLAVRTNIKLILRGTPPLDFLANADFEVEYRNNFVSDAQIKKELDDADILYLPIKFTSPEFYKYSLSTKMIGYLGTSGTILYHGPAEGAACKLLNRHNAAVCCTSLKEDDMLNAMKTIMHKGCQFSRNSKDLATKEFSMEKIHSRFWQT